MHDELKEEQIVNKVGGRFKLSTLIQKRMVALNTGARPLVDVRGGDKMATVIQEILQDKIYLDASGQVQTRGPRVPHLPARGSRHAIPRTTGSKRGERSTGFSSTPATYGDWGTRFSGRTTSIRQAGVPRTTSPMLIRRS